MKQISLAILDTINLLPEYYERLKELAVSPLDIPAGGVMDMAELVRRTGDAEAVLVSPWSRLDAQYFASCPSVKYVGLAGTSLANIDLVAVRERGVTVTNIADFGNEPAAEYAFMQLMMLARGVRGYQWKDLPCELMGKKLGILGMGGLGKAVAHLALGLKMDTYYYSLRRKGEWEERGVKYAELGTMLLQCDVVVICSPTNVKVLRAPEFAAMKPNSVLIQLSVGEVFDVDPFRHWMAAVNNFALLNQSAGRSVLDAIRDIPNVEIADIVAGYTKETRQRLGEGMIRKLKEYIETQ